MHRALVHLLTTLAFMASLLAAPASLVGPVKKGDAAFDAARLAMLQMAKPSARKVEGTRGPGPVLAAVVVAAPPLAVAARIAPPAPNTWTPPALDRSELMVFLI